MALSFLLTHCILHMWPCSQDPDSVIYKTVLKGILDMNFIPNPVLAITITYFDCCHENQTKAFLNHSRVDEYGFHRPDDFDYSSYEEFMSSYIRILARRASRWDSFLRGVNKVRKSRRGKRTLQYWSLLLNMLKKWPLSIDSDHYHVTHENYMYILCSQ